MIGTQGADVLVLLTLISIGVWGVIAGAVTSLVRRRPWGPQAALIDAALAASVAIVLVFLTVEVEGFFGLYLSLSTPVSIAAVASVVIRRFLLPRPSGSGPRID